MPLHSASAWLREHDLFNAVCGDQREGIAGIYGPYSADFPRYDKIPFIIVVIG